MSAEINRPFSIPLLFAMLVGAISGALGRTALTYISEHDQGIEAVPHLRGITLVCTALALALFVRVAITLAKSGQSVLLSGLAKLRMPMAFLIPATAVALYQIFGHPAYLAFSLLPFLPDVISYLSTDRLAEALNLSSFPQDSIGREQVVSEIISQLEKGSPVIALTGGFGDGKSWVFGSLEERLKIEDKYVVVSIKAWLPSSDSQIIRACIESIAAGLSRFYPFSEFAGPLRRYGAQIVRLGPDPISKLGDLIVAPSQEDQIESLRRRLASLNRRLVVLLDEVDRMQKDELLALLKFIRGTDLFPNLSFVCALHKPTVVAQFDADSSSGSAYVEKFFPLQIALPTIDTDILSRLFDERFNAFIDRLQLLTDEESKKNFEERFKKMWRRNGNKYISNIRKLDLFFAALEAAFRSIALEVDAADMILLEMLRFVSPAAYDFASWNRAYLSFSEWSWMHYDLIPFDKEKRSHERTRLLDDLQKQLGPERADVFAILEELFPLVRSKKKGFDAALDQGEARRRKRIFHPAFVGIYFNRLPALGRLSGSEAQRILNMLLIENDDQSAVNAIVEELNGTRFEQVRIDLLEAIIERFDELPTSRAKLLALKLCAQNIPFAGAFTIGASEAGLTSNTVFLAASRVDAEDRGKGEEFLVSCIAASRSIALAREIRVKSANHDDRSILLRNVVTHDENLQTAFADRFKKEFIDGQGSLFVLEREFASAIMYAMGGPTKAILQGYLAAAFEKSSETLSLFLSWTREGPNTKWQFTSQFIDDGVLRKIVEKFAKAPLGVRTEEREQFEEFLRIKPEPVDISLD